MKLQTASRETYEEADMRPAFLNRFREMDTTDMCEKPETGKWVDSFLPEVLDNPQSPVREKL